MSRLGRLTLVVAAVLALAGIDAVQRSAAAMATPAIMGQASASGFPVGVSIFDSATISNGASPSGTITFYLYGKDDPTCAAAPIFTTWAAVQGNGYHQSPTYTANEAGTYRWTATYSGDGNNSPAGPTSCSAASAAVTVAKRMPSVGGTATTLGPSGPIGAQGKINGGGPAGPQGTMTFLAYGPDDQMCSGTPVHTEDVPVIGSKLYLASYFQPALPGAYQWTVSYSGDANNFATMTTCADPAGNVRVTAPSVTLTVSPTTVARSGTVTVSWSGITSPSSGDWIALVAAASPDSAVRAWRYTSGTASGSVTLKVPWSAPPGAYEIRLFANNDVLRLAKAPLTVG